MVSSSVRRFCFARRLISVSPSSKDVSVIIDTTAVNFGGSVFGTARLRSARPRSNSRTTPGWQFFVAQNSAVLPSLSGRSGKALWPSSVRTLSTCPSRLA
eukprot:221285-Prymnesium_polylepis.1